RGARPATLNVSVGAGRGRHLAVRPLLLAAAAALLFAGAGSAYDRPACATPDTRSAWNAVFGHASTKAGAQALRRRAEAVSFKHLRLNDRGCGHWQVEVRDAALGSFTTRQAFYAEAQGA